LALDEFIKSNDLSQEWGEIFKAYQAAGFPDNWVGFGEVVPSVEGWRIPYESADDMVRVPSLPNSTVYSLYVAWAQHKD